MSRPAKVLINLDALRQNLATVRHLTPRSKILAVVKADAYGHGLERVAAALRDADGFGVACLEEAIQLRSAGITGKILLLEGAHDSSELAQICDLQLDVVIHNRRQLDHINAAEGYRFNVWLKIDTGMHRLGFPAEELSDLLCAVKACGDRIAELRLMSHLATANEPGNLLTRQQLQRFASCTAGVEAEKSLANSAAVLEWPESHYDWVRPGLMLYGISPVAGSSGQDSGLQPVMTFRSGLIAVKQLRQGDAVGYGATWMCPEDMPVGIVAAGYADGFPRHAGPASVVLVNGCRCPVIGKASMDMLSVDLRPCADAGIGAVVELWGPALPVEEVARNAATTPYDILTAVHKRLEYLEHGDPG